MPDIILESVRTTQKTIIIPERNEYPDVRLTVNSGVIQAAGDRVRITLKVMDKNGVDRIPDQVVVVKFKDMPADPNYEILGALTFGVAESPKPVVSQPDGQ